MTTTPDFTSGASLRSWIYGSGSLKDINRYSTPPVVSRMELERLTPLTPWLTTTPDFTSGASLRSCTAEVRSCDRRTTTELRELTKIQSIGCFQLSFLYDSLYCRQFADQDLWQWQLGVVLLRSGVVTGERPRS
jgi:hypothetical protein